MFFIYVKIRLTYYFVFPNSQKDKISKRFSHFSIALFHIILFEKSSGSVFFKDVHTNEVTKKDISTLSFMKRIGKIYNIYELYQTIYQKEDLEEFKEFLNNPSSNNPTSTFK